jgi:hypothetical protein
MTHPLSNRWRKSWGIGCDETQFSPGNLTDETARQFMVGTLDYCDGCMSLVEPYNGDCCPECQVAESEQAAERAKDPDGGWTIRHLALTEDYVFSEHPFPSAAAAHAHFDDAETFARKCGGRSQLRHHGHVEREFCHFAENE